MIKLESEALSLQKGDLSSVQRALDAKAEVNAKDPRGINETALHFAVMGGKLQLARNLIEVAKADLEAENESYLHQSYCEI